MMPGSEHLYKILAVERILQDNPSGITTKEILNKLDNLFDIKAERKSIYDNIAVLTRFMPIDVIRKNGKYLYYLQESGAKKNEQCKFSKRTR